MASLLVDIREGRSRASCPLEYAHDKMLLEFLIICAHIIIMSTYLHCYYYHHLICLLFWCCSRKEAMYLVCSNQSQKLKLKQKEQQNRKEEETKDTSLPFFALFLIYKGKQERGGELNLLILFEWNHEPKSESTSSDQANSKCVCVAMCCPINTFTLTN